MKTAILSLEEVEIVIRRIAGPKLIQELGKSMKPDYITSWLVRPVPALNYLTPLEYICAGNRDAVMRCAISMGGNAYT